MNPSKFTPQIIYINVPDGILFSPTPNDTALNNILFSSLGILKIPYITHLQMIAAAYVVMSETKQSLPYRNESVSSISKTERTTMNVARDEFVRNILQLITIVFSDGMTEYIFDDQDISKRVSDTKVIRDSDYQTWVNGIDLHLSTVLAADNCTVAFVATDPRRITKDKMNPIVGIIAPSLATSKTRGGRLLRLRKKADAILALSNVESLCNSLVSIIDEFTELHIQAHRLRVDLVEERIKLEPQFQRDTWPSYTLITHLKGTVREVVQNVISRSSEVCDPLDLEYQTLFRLTSLPLASVFDNGDDPNHETK